MTYSTPACMGLALAAFSCVSPQIAAAQSLTGNVGSAGISECEQSVEARLGFDEDGNAGTRLHYDNAFTGWYQLRVITAFSKPEDGDWDFSALTLENWLQWSEEGADGKGFNGGLRFAYGFADGPGADEAEVRLTVTDRFADGWEWRANLMGEVETGDGSEGGVSLESRAQLTRAVQGSIAGSRSMRLGLELFSEWGNSRDLGGFDEQAHQVGPVAKLSWSGGAYLQTAVRFGLTEASDDAMFKLFVGREF